MLGFSNLQNQDIIPCYWNAVNQILINQSLIQRDKIIFQEEPIGYQHGLQDS